MAGTLDELPIGTQAVVVDVQGEPRLTQRLMELGLFEGEAVAVLSVAPLGDPIEVAAGGSRLSLRRAEARCVAVRPAH